MDYVGGSLKLKNVKKKPLKKKKKDSKKLAEKVQEHSSRDKSPLEENGVSTYQMLRSKDTDSAMPMTEAQKHFESVQEQRLLQKAKNERLKTHKDRIDEYNRLLESQSEHFDMPKIGPG
ncbi:hypothetical protein POMI540_3292 [Schizosaccharomyces pombe]|uniref:Uncharacterized protein C31G5.21 n=1 Tax=Schizosaccharomyces pombe (strain 972 / ATCC 24843) TaxID=284812 RepID=YEJL_SCHPO|eukprot:NP_594013.1 FAM32A family protein [Schizosaccharomyces pombe]